MLRQGRAGFGVQANRMARRLLLLVWLALVTWGCVVPRPAAALPKRDEAWLAVLSGEMPPPIDLVSRHAWIIVHLPNGREQRFEYGGGGGGDAFDDFTGGDVQVHGVIRGTADEMSAKIECLEEASHFAQKEHPGYFPIPGPNSNTYIDILLRHCSIPIELPATAIGRDYRGIVGASVTESRTGVQLETPLFGLRLGLVDGIEVHLLAFVFGVHFWPPGITIPVNPGRIGFASDGHVTRPHQIDRQEPHDDRPVDRKYGLGNAWLSLNVARPIDPAKMGGLEGRGTLGFLGRGLYGTRVGYGFGMDFELGMGVPVSFAYSVHLYPTGIGVMFGPTGYVGLFAGIGTSGVTTLVEPALEFPLEARLELDATRYARLGFYARSSWNVGTPTRQQSALANPYFDELAFGAFARFGKTRQWQHEGYLGSGYFIGVERRELAGSAWLGFTLGVETDAAW